MLPVKYAPRTVTRPAMSGLDGFAITSRSRSRKSLWRKGDTSGQVQTVTEMRTDCDQDAILMKVTVAGDGNSCHTGRPSCFYRKVNVLGGGRELVFEAH